MLVLLGGEMVAEMRRGRRYKHEKSHSYTLKWFSLLQNLR